MHIPNVKALLGKIFPHPHSVPLENLPQTQNLSDKDKQLLRSIGMTVQSLTTAITKSIEINYDRVSLYRELDRALSHPLIAASAELYSDVACLVGSTTIPLLDGRVLSITDIVNEFKVGTDLWVYSCTTEGVPKPARITAAWEQPQKIKTYRIHLDNGKYVEASFNHKFIKRDGSLCFAENLVVGDSLLPFHRSVNVASTGYECVWDVKLNNWRSTYKVVAENYYNINLSECNRGKSYSRDHDKFIVVHHRDFNKDNNVPSNLQVMTSGDHIKLHSSSLKDRWKDPNFKAMMSYKSRISHNTPEYKKKASEINKLIWQRENAESRKEKFRQMSRVRAIVNPGYIEKMRAALTGRKLSIKHRNSISNGLLVLHMPEKVEFICPYCGKHEFINPSNKKKYCNRTCKSIASRTPREVRLCACGCGRSFECSITSIRKYFNNACNRRVPREVKKCLNENCGKEFIVPVYAPTKYCSAICSNTCKKANAVRGAAISKTKLAGVANPSYNHKIVRIECIGEQTVYDISVEGSHLFGLDCGIYVHNSMYNSTANSSVWITSPNKSTSNTLNKLLDTISIEEHIYDWCWTVGSFGDLFIKVNAAPDIGVISINDDAHPLDISRVDLNGTLIGFVDSPNGGISESSSLMAPWQFVHCLEGSTRIKLLDGTSPTIKEMADNRDVYVGKHTLSINPNTLQLEPDKILDVSLTRKNASLVRVHLDNGKYVDCTPDHRFMLRDGTYKEARDLLPNESLMPLYSEMSSKYFTGYEVSFNPRNQRWYRTHSLVAKYYNKISRKHVVHHRDFNKLNNEPSNLCVMSTKDHHDYHSGINHRDDCNCVPCQHKKGIYTRPLHKENCSCPFCKGKRGERRGEDCFNYIPRIQIPCACGCGGLVTIQTRGRACATNKRYLRGHSIRVHNPLKDAIHKSDCKCSKCKMKRGDLDRSTGFDSISTRICKYCGEVFENISLGKLLNHYKSHKRDAILINHKVVKIEFLSTSADVYDISMERNHNFPLEVGVFVHNCRLLGARRKRNLYGEMNFNASREVLTMGAERGQLSSKYGVSLFVNSLPIYKRLRLAEDSLLLTRLNGAVRRYIWKVKVTGTNSEAVAELMDEYKRVLKTARAFDKSTGAGNGNFEEKLDIPGSLTDLILPVFGDVGDITKEEIGGMDQVKWIVDIDDLRNQLACSLRTPLSLLGGYVSDATGALGSEALEQLGIRFAQNARRLQRAIKSGIARLCQIHLAYKGMDPSASSFTVHMSETSAVEENQLRDNLDKGVDSIVKVMDLLDTLDVDYDKPGVFQYFNQKFLKLEDFDINRFLKNKNINFQEEIDKLKARKELSEKMLYLDSDLKSYLPVRESYSPRWLMNETLWKSKYSSLKIKKAV